MHGTIKSSAYRSGVRDLNDVWPPPVGTKPYGVDALSGRKPSWMDRAGPRIPTDPEWIRSAGSMAERMGRCHNIWKGTVLSRGDYAARLISIFEWDWAAPFEGDLEAYYALLVTDLMDRKITAGQMHAKRKYAAKVWRRHKRGLQPEWIANT